MTRADWPSKWRVFWLLLGLIAGGWWYFYAIANGYGIPRAVTHLVTGGR
jgi:hypothetical protein